MAIRLLIADDHPVVRDGLKSMLADEGDFDVVAEASGGDEAVSLAARHRPQLVLLDVRMNDGDGLTALARLQQQFPDVAVVMFSGHDNPTYVARAAALGAAGFLEKTASRDDLIDAMRRAAEGHSLWTREKLRRAAQGHAAGTTAAEIDAALTKREGEVLRKLALGLSNKEIAQSLDISYETVKEHVQHILRKLGVADRTQAAVWAVRNGLA